ncbi:hypothetical protein [Streptomyces sp. N50]|uniref:hypothetical protein n=1 Tax=Streptomyces sp. N50 TaxID=3081765 RepID=UPI002961FC01|nr:hypothetical protein [Streptomyces sp. N50]WOX10673.1 hypothetical protein R2B38_18305 [Streptomyces sp. N50]
MTDGFMGPPWQMDWRLDALAARDALPDRIREIVHAVRAELVTAKDPYFRGIETDADLPEGMTVEPALSSQPKGARMFFFDQGKGWLVYTFVPRVEDPQIVVEQVFWLGGESPEEPLAESW